MRLTYSDVQHMCVALARVAIAPPVQIPMVDLLRVFTAVLAKAHKNLFPYASCLLAPLLTMTFLRARLVELTSRCWQLTKAARMLSVRGDTFRQEQSR